MQERAFQPIFQAQIMALDGLQDKERTPFSLTGMIMTNTARARLRICNKTGKQTIKSSFIDCFLGFVERLGSLRKVFPCRGIVAVGDV